MENRQQDDTEKFTALSCGVADYNDRCSLAPLMAGSLFDYLPIEGEDEKDEGGEPNSDGEDTIARPSFAENIRQRRDITIGSLRDEHTDALRSLGLSIQPFYGGTTVYGLEGGTIEQTQVWLSLRHKDAFLTFLSRLSPEQSQSDSVLRQALRTFVTDFTKQIAKGMQCGTKDDHFITILESLEPIVQQYEHLGLSDDTKELRAYLHYAKRRLLREYITVQKQCLLPESFGWHPDDWQKDMAPSALRSRWEKALQTLDIVRQKPQGTELYLRALRYCTDCCARALEQLGESTANYAGALRQNIGDPHVRPSPEEKVEEMIVSHKEHVAAFRAILQKTLVRLQTLSSLTQVPASLCNTQGTPDS